MPDVTITCPQCAFTRKVFAGKVPKREVRVVCPRCKEGFSFNGGSPVPAAVRPPPQAVLSTAEQEAPPPVFVPATLLNATETWRVAPRFRHLLVVLMVLLLLPLLVSSLFVIRPNLAQTVVLQTALQFIFMAAAMAFICWRIKAPLFELSAGGIRVINSPFSSGQVSVDWQEVIGIKVRESALFGVKNIRITLLLGQPDQPLRELIINPKIAERADALVKRLREQFPPLTAELLHASGHVGKVAADEVRFGAFILSRAGIAVARQLIPWSCLSEISTPQLVVAGYGGVTLFFSGGINPVRQAVAAKMNPDYQKFVRTLLAYAPQASIDPGVAKIIACSPQEAKKESVVILLLVFGLFSTLAAVYFTIYYEPVVSLKALLAFIAGASGIIPFAVTVQRFAGKFLGKSVPSAVLLPWAGAACGGPLIALVLLFSLFPSALYTLRGDLAVNGGDKDTAVRCYQQALAECPDNLDASFGLALLYREKKEYDRAFDCLQRIYQVDPRNWHVFGIELIPDSLLKAGRYAEALQWCDRICLDHPHWRDGVNAMANKRQEIMRVKRQVEG